MRALVVALLVLLSLSVVSPAQCQTLEQVKKQHIEKALSTADGEEIKKSVEKYSKVYNVDRNLILAIIMTESGFNKNAYHSCGSAGLMQLMPGTFRARNVGSSIYDIDQNIHAGTKHMGGLMARYKGNVYLALSAYNVGGGALDKYNGQIHPATKTYVDRVFYHKAIIDSMSI